MSFVNDDGNSISPWHDVPLTADPTDLIFNMVVEIPRGTKEKLEVD